MTNGMVASVGHAVRILATSVAITLFIAAMSLAPLGGQAQAQAQATPAQPHAMSTCNGVAPSGTVIGMEATSDDGGYWIATNYGEVIACGDAPYFGDADIDHNYPIVGFAAEPDDDGYYLAASNGGIFVFGDAPFDGSADQTPLNKPIIGMAVDSGTGGYWLVASDGGIFAFNAPFLGSTGAIRLNQPVVGMAVDPGTGGYWLVASDGGIFSYGAPFLGSTGNITLNRPITGMEANSTGSGYRFVASDGGIFDYGSAFYGSVVEAPAITSPPGSPPTCSVSLSYPTPKEYMGETVTITSNVPNYQAVLAKVYTTGTSYDAGFSTDANGTLALMINITTAPIGQPARIAVAVGPAFCTATFTPS